MAEGWGKALLAGKANCYSAGTKKHGMNPWAIKVMAEIGIDISTHTSKTVDELPPVKFDIVYTVCGDANENCPFFPGANIVHVGFDDPPRLTKHLTDEAEILPVYRRVRDEIKNFIETLERDAK